MILTRFAPPAVQAALQNRAFRDDGSIETGSARQCVRAGAESEVGVTLAAEDPTREAGSVAKSAGSKCAWNPAERPRFFAQVLVEEGILTPEDLRELLDAQQQLEPPEQRPIGRLAVERGFLDEARFAELLDRHCRRLRLGELLILRGLLSLADLNHALQEQAMSGGRLGEVLIRLSLIDPARLAQGLCQQSGAPFVPITAIAPEPDLVRWINPAFASRNGIVPVRRVGRNLTVAAWQPRALALAGDLIQSTGLNVQVILTNQAEVEERIRKLYAS